MRRVIAVLAVLVAASLAAQEATEYTPSDNPFQAEFAFVTGQPVNLKVEVAGVRLDTLSVTPRVEVTGDFPITCDVVFAGSSEATRKVVVTAVLLLEDSAGKSLEKLNLDPFKVKPGRAFDERQSMKVAGSSLRGAAKVYVFVEVGQ
jgi:hypothetical protein